MYFEAISEPSREGFSSLERTPETYGVQMLVARPNSGHNEEASELLLGLCSEDQSLRDPYLDMIFTGIPVNEDSIRARQVLSQVKLETHLVWNEGLFTEFWEANYGYRNGKYWDYPYLMETLKGKFEAYVISHDGPQTELDSAIRIAKGYRPWLITVEKGQQLNIREQIDGYPDKYGLRGQFPMKNIPRFLNPEDGLTVFYKLPPAQQLEIVEKAAKVGNTEFIYRVINNVVHAPDSLEIVARSIVAIARLGYPVEVQSIISRYPNNPTHVSYLLLMLLNFNSKSYSAGAGS